MLKDKAPHDKQQITVTKKQDTPREETAKTLEPGPAHLSANQEITQVGAKAFN